MVGPGIPSGVALLSVVIALVALPASVNAETRRSGAPTGPFGLTAGASASASASVKQGRTAAGLFAFRSGGKWFTGKRVISMNGDRERGRVRIATDDPQGRQIAFSGRRIRGRAFRYVIRIAGQGPAVEVVRFGMLAEPGERLLGFGERSDHVDQRGNRVENYVGEGPYQTSEYPLIAISVPPWGLRRRSDATYFPMPWLLSTEGYGVLVDNLETSRFDLDSKGKGWWTVQADTDELRVRFFGGGTPAEALRRMTSAIGRQPKPAAPWLFGPWFQTGHGNTQPAELDFVDTLRDADAPISAVETHMRYMPCGSDLGSEAEEAARTTALHDRGLAAVTYTREAICASYTGPFDAAVAAGAFLKRENGDPYLFDAFAGSGTTRLGMLDFSDPDAAGIYGSILDRAYGAGYDGWMEDYGEYAPPDSVAASGMDGRRLHNYYPVMYHRAGMEYVRTKERPVIRFTRSGWTGAAKHSQIVWGGDPSVGWGFDGLTSSVRQALTMGLSGVSLWGSDIGGFFSLSDDRLDPELLARWIQFGAFSGVMRSKGEGIGRQPMSLRPQIFEQPTLPLWRRYAKLRTQIYPYLVSADRAYRRTGMPIMRHLALTDPSDRRATKQEYEYMFGPDLLVAPVLGPGRTERSVYLPRGHWVDFNDAVTYGDAEGSFDLGSARTIRGGRPVEVSAPLEEIPLMIRAGALLPMLPPDTETLAGYSPAAHTGLDDNRSSLHLIALPRGDSSRGLYDTGSMASSENRRGWRLKFNGGMPVDRPFSLDLDASMKVLKRPFVPTGVKINGRSAQGWTYDHATGVLNLKAEVPVNATILVSR